MKGFRNKSESNINYKFNTLFLFLTGVLLLGIPALSLAQNSSDLFINIDTELTGVISSSSAWGDFDGDGDLDLVISGYDDSISQGNTTLYENEEGVFSDTGADLLGANLGDVSWGDYDDDGDLDLVITGDDGSDTEYAAIYQNNGDGTFSDIEAGLLGVDKSAANWGDFDGDDDLDLIVTGADSSNNQTAIIYENEDGIFTDAEAGLTGVDDSCNDFGDFDGDGDLDLIIAGEESPFEAIAIIYENNDGTFTDIEAGITGVEEGSCNWGDYDNDGDLDLVLSGVDASDEKSATIYNNDDGAFLNIEAGLEGVEESSSDWGDFDNDDDLDLVITGANTSGDASTTIYRNDDGNFTAIDIEIIGVENGSSTWGDFDGDGNEDLVVTGEGEAVIYQNQEGETTSMEEPTKPIDFVLMQNYPNPFNPSTVISYQLPVNSAVRLEVFDMVGRKVATLLDGERKSAGKYTITFDGSALASGMYIYRLHAGDNVFTKKLTLIK